MEMEFKEKLTKFMIIDSHLHLGRMSYLNIPSNSDEKMISIEKDFCIKKALFSHHGALSTFKLGIEKTLEVLEKYPDFLRAYLVFNPNFGEENLRVIKKYIKKPQVVGVKIHPSWHCCFPYDFKYEKFWRFAAENEIVVLTHCWNPDVANKAQKFSDPLFFEKIINKFKGFKLILAHAGGRGIYHYKVIDIIERNEDIFTDFSGDIFVPGLIEEFVRRIGSGKLLFGTDMPWVDVRYYLANMLAAEISDADRANIFGLNILKLFGPDKIK